MNEIDDKTGQEPRVQTEPLDVMRVTRYPDELYRWIGSVNLFRDPTILFMAWKIFFFVCLGLFVFMCLLNLGDSDFFWEGFLDTAKIGGIITLGMLALCLLGYLIYAWIMKGKYTVFFQMGDGGFTHTQVPEQAKKAKAISAATFLAGLMQGNPTTMGIGLTSARTAMSTYWKSVRSIQGFPKRGVIKVNERLNKNQLYVKPEDYDFVWNYVKERCPQAKIK